MVGSGNSGTVEWWKNGGMAEWRNGGKNGGMANGGTVEWWNGYMPNLPDIFTVHTDDTDTNTF